VGASEVEDETAGGEGVVLRVGFELRRAPPVPIRLLERRMAAV
jgi:hypothetical protein